MLHRVPRIAHFWDIKTKSMGSAQFGGYYAQISLFLTGENKPYDSSDGVFGRLIPNRDFSIKENGKGAWEIAARISHLDMNDAEINGGELDTVTAGLNWYLNPNTRIMFNYIRADTEGLYDDKTDIAQMRIQVDF